MTSSEVREQGYRLWRDLLDLFRVACRVTSARRQGAPSGVRAGAGDTSNYVEPVPGPSNKGEAQCK